MTATLAALALGYVLQAPWPLLALAAALWVVGSRLKGLARILAFLAAPLALAVGTRVSLANPALLLAAAGLAVFSLFPLADSFGPAPRLLKPLAFAGASLTPLFLLVAVPAGRAILESDLAFGAIVVALACGTLVASTLPLEALDETRSRRNRS